MEHFGQFLRTQVTAACASGGGSSNSSSSSESAASSTGATAGQYSAVPEAHSAAPSESPPPPPSQTDQRSDHLSEDDETHWTDPFRMECCEPLLRAPAGIQGIKEGEMETISHQMLRLEMEHFIRVLNSLRHYQEWQTEKIFKKRKDWDLLPSRFRAMLPARNERVFTEQLRLIHMNQYFLDSVIRSVDIESQFSGRMPMFLNPESLIPGDPLNMGKVRGTLKQCLRDWSDQGLSEREECYVRITRFMDEVLFRDIPIDQRYKIRVLNPGAGLARLPWELARLGFRVEANEFDYFMLICSRFILHSCHEPRKYVIFPFCDSLSNVYSHREGPFQPCAIPDISPQTLITEGLPHSHSLLSLVAGEFCQVYGRPKKSELNNIAEDGRSLGSEFEVVRSTDVGSRIAGSEQRKRDDTTTDVSMIGDDSISDEVRREYSDEAVVPSVMSPRVNSVDDKSSACSTQLFAEAVSLPFPSSVPQSGLLSSDDPICVTAVAASPDADETADPITERSPSHHHDSGPSSSGHPGLLAVLTDDVIAHGEIDDSSLLLMQHRNGVSIIEDASDESAIDHTAEEEPSLFRSTPAAQSASMTSASALAVPLPDESPLSEIVNTSRTAEGIGVGSLTTGDDVIGTLQSCDSPMIHGSPMLPCDSRMRRNHSSDSSRDLRCEEDDSGLLTDPSLPPSDGIGASESRCEKRPRISENEESGRFEVVITCFFLDTAHNVLEYLDVICNQVLVEGGYLIHFGPLLYHFDGDAHGQPSVELSWEELRHCLIEHFGMEIVSEDRRCRTTYVCDRSSMAQTSTYHCVFLVARKRPKADLVPLSVGCALYR